MPSRLTVFLESTQHVVRGWLDAALSGAHAGCHACLTWPQVVSICAGNNLHGDAFVRLYGSLGNAVSNTVGPLN